MKLSTAQAEAFAAQVDAVRSEIGRIIVGQEAIVLRLLLALLVRGHVLLEGVPGLAKTLMVSVLSRVIDVDFQRIQFTPDLMPSDIIGSLVYEQGSGEFVVKRGPIFSHLILADEVNRAPAKVQSALLEAMQERQVTIGEQTMALPQPFLVMATQNPIDQEGTYRLPEAQLDRFIFKLKVDYPSCAEERLILDREFELRPEQRPVEARLGRSQIVALQEAVDAVAVAEPLRDTIVRIVDATRHPANYQLDDIERLIEFGASVRATIALGRASQALALVRGRDHVLPEDIIEITPDVLRHRLSLSFEAQAQGVTADDIITSMLSAITI